jgi:hypothetical protein
MKSSEILRESILDEYSDTDPAIVKHLQDKGYKLLDQGVDQTAFLEPETGLVLKIFGTQNNVALAPNDENTKSIFSKEQMMFFRWGKYCNNHKSNPFLPKFSGFESFYWNGHVYIQMRQERLNSIGAIGKLCKEMADRAMANESFEDVAQTLTYPVWGYKNSWDKLLNILGPRGVHVFYKTIVRLNDIANQMGYELDLHGYNFMARADGTPVIIDPWIVY